MVLQVAAHAFQRMQNGNARFGQPRARADAGALQYLH
jgi:hypothetical protein